MQLCRPKRRCTLARLDAGGSGIYRESGQTRQQRVASFPEGLGSRLPGCRPGGDGFRAFCRSPAGKKLWHRPHAVPTDGVGQVAGVSSCVLIASLHSLHATSAMSATTDRCPRLASSVLIASLHSLHSMNAMQPFGGACNDATTARWGARNGDRLNGRRYSGCARCTPCLTPGRRFLEPSGLSGWQPLAHARVTTACQALFPRAGLAERRPPGTVALRGRCIPGRTLRLGPAGRVPTGSGLAGALASRPTWDTWVSAAVNVAARRRHAQGGYLLPGIWRTTPVWWK
jgi:hypothetical protein